MGYFPFFVDLTGVPGLVAGGGTVALRKVEALLPFGAELTVVSPAFRPELENLPGLTLRRESFREEMLEGMAFVIAATDDRAVNREIARACRARKIPVNAVDDREACTFLFPALVREGPLTVGISTGGASPAAAAWLRRTIQNDLPENFGEILRCLERARPLVRARMEREADRGAFWKELLAVCLDRGGPLSEREILERLAEKEGMA